MRSGCISLSVCPEYENTLIFHVGIKLGYPHGDFCPSSAPSEYLPISRIVVVREVSTRLLLLALLADQGQTNTPHPCVQQKGKLSRVPWEQEQTMG
jgi:hypothetical protein